MQYNRELQQQLDTQIQNLTPELQAHITQLQKDSDKLRFLFYFDPGDALRLSHFLGHALVEYLSTPIVYDNISVTNCGEPLSAFFDIFMQTMRYADKRFPDA